MESPLANIARMAGIGQSVLQSRLMGEKLKTLADVRSAAQAAIETPEQKLGPGNISTPDTGPTFNRDKFINNLYEKGRPLEAKEYEAKFATQDFEVYKQNKQLEISRQDSLLAGLNLAESGNISGALKAVNIGRNQGEMITNITPLKNGRYRIESQQGQPQVIDAKHMRIALTTAQAQGVHELNMEAIRLKERLSKDGDNVTPTKLTGLAIAKMIANQKAGLDPYAGLQDSETALVKKFYGGVDVSKSLSAVLSTPLGMELYKKGNVTDLADLIVNVKGAFESKVMEGVSGKKYRPIAAADVPKGARIVKNQANDTLAEVNGEWRLIQD